MITHGGGFTHEMGGDCPHCHSLHRVVERDGRDGPYVLLEAVAVHTYGCPNTRHGKKYGPCTCGAHEMWQRRRVEMAAIVLEPPA